MTLDTLKVAWVLVLLALAVLAGAFLADKAAAVVAGVLVLGGVGVWVGGLIWRRQQPLKLQTKLQTWGISRIGRPWYILGFRSYGAAVFATA